MLVPCSWGQGEALPRSDQTAEEIDEAYFLMRALEYYYGNLPVNSPDRQSFVEATRGTRADAIALKVRAEAISMPEIAARYEDFIQVLDHLAEFYTDSEALVRATEAQATSDHITSGTNGLGAATSTFGVTSSAGLTPEESAIWSAVGGGLVYLLELSLRAEDREAQALATADRLLRRLSDTLQENNARARQTAQHLAEERGWNAPEVGWETSTTTVEVLDQYLQNHDYNEAAKILAAISDDRPRDLFVRLARNRVYSNLLSDSKSRIQLAEDFQAARSLVPPVAAYDAYRLTCLEQAMRQASVATYYERCEGKAKIGPSEISSRALALLNEYTEITGPGMADDIRHLHAYVLLNHGDATAAHEHLQSLKTTRWEDSSFRFLLACSSAQRGSWDYAFQALDYAMGSGDYTPAYVRFEPTLAPLRDHDLTKFRSIVNPRWSWMVTNDLLQDDIVLRNDSPYPLSNVRFRVHLAKGAINKDLDLSCRWIAPGEVYTWKDVVAGVEGTWDQSRSRISLSCDQSE